jgi:hypothetical protein
VSTNARWIIGLLVAVVIGLAAGLIIVAADSADDDQPDTVTVPSVPRTVTQPPPTETQEPAPQTETGGGQDDDAGPGNGGLGTP